MWYSLIPCKACMASLTDAFFDPTPEIHFFTWAICAREIAFLKISVFSCGFLGGKQAEARFLEQFTRPKHFPEFYIGFFPSPLRGRVG